MMQMELYRLQQASHKLENVKEKLSTAKSSGQRRSKRQSESEKPKKIKELTKECYDALREIGKGNEQREQELTHFVVNYTTVRSFIHARIWEGDFEWVENVKRATMK